VIGTASAYETSIARINVGGHSHVDSQGRQWQADNGFNTGRVAPVSSEDVSGTTEDALFQSQRWDPDSAPELTYSFNVPDGDYVVRLLLAETCSCVYRAGMRRFDVAVEAQTVLTDVDIFADAGGAHRALEHRIPTTVSDGRLDVTFLHRVENPSVAGIEILRVIEDGPAQPGLLHETWTDIDGLTLDELRGSPQFPDNPSDERVAERFEVTDGMVAENNYGSRLRGFVRPPTTGHYRFFVAGDDQAELRLSTDAEAENASVIAYAPSWTQLREWDLYSEQRSGSIHLEADRRYYIEALHKEGWGGGHVSVAWQGPGIERQVIEGEFLVPWGTDPGSGGDSGSDPGGDEPAGLEGRYYTGTFDDEPDLVRIDSRVDFRWGSGSPDGLPGNGFQVRWEGQVIPAHGSGTQSYTFHTVSDDGVRLWVGDELVIDNWTLHGETEDTAAVPLQAGQAYAIRMEYFESGGQATAQLCWSTAGTPREIIPASQLRATTSTEDPATDTDGDGVPDSEDAFPNDPDEWADLDGDGIGDNADTDTDGDGMPDQWELDNGLDPRDSSDADADLDGDGQTNAEEYEAGTDPTEPPADEGGDDGRVSWTAPTRWTDSTPISMSEIGGYYIHYGTARGTYTETVQIDDAYVTEHTVTDLTPGETYYFVVTAYDVSGGVSDYSAEVSFAP
jgi:hypothetical protein